MKRVATYCYQCVAGPDLLTVKVEDGVASEVEPNFAAAALAIADRGYVLETGRVVLTGTGTQLLADAGVRAAYLGL